MAKPRLSWRRQPNEQGLARMCQGERGYDLMLSGKWVLQVRPVRNCWYWYGIGRNTLNEPYRSTFATPEEAKAHALAAAKANLLQS